MVSFIGLKVFLVSSLQSMLYIDKPNPSVDFLMASIDLSDSMSFSSMSLQLLLSSLLVNGFARELLVFTWCIVDNDGDLTMGICFSLFGEITRKVSSVHSHDASCFSASSRVRNEANWHLSHTQASPAKTRTRRKRSDE